MQNTAGKHLRSSMIYGVRSSERLVYHYTTLEIARDFVLKDRTLKLGPYANTNDPKESTSWVFSFANWSGADAPPITEVSSARSTHLKRRVRISSFCLDRLGLSGDHLRDILLRGFARPRMWAQYGGNHRGVCLVFDKQKLLGRIAEQNSGRTVFGAVRYVDHGPLPTLSDEEFLVDFNRLTEMGLEQYSQWHLEAHIGPLIFEKLSDWKDENEWRVAAVRESDDDLFVGFGDSLVGVVHGARVSETESLSLISFSDDPEIEHVGLAWRNHCPWYRLSEPWWQYSGRRILGR